MYLLRFLVLSGLFFHSLLFAGVNITTNPPTGISVSRDQACEKVRAYYVANTTPATTATVTTCFATGGTITLGNGNVANFAIYTACTASFTNFDYVLGRGGGLTALASQAMAVLESDSLPPPSCDSGCVKILTSTGSPFIDTFQSSLGGGDPFFSTNKNPVKSTYTGDTCVMPPPCAVGTLPGIDNSCFPDPEYCPPPNVKDPNGVCKPPLPICISPQVLNQNKICETPMCPVGQVRETSFSACKPIVCTPPLIKEGNFCVMPKCAVGETYEYRDGIGQCVRNDPVCIPPQTLVNGVCKTPTCATGMILSPAGSCIPDPAINPNTKGSTGQAGTGTGSTGTGSGTTGTGTGTGGTGTTTGTGGSGGGTGTGTGTTGTSTGGTTGGASGAGGGGGGTTSNTGGTGLCTTPPCGNCDPAKETCGDTFGGSCKSGFQCNGDAIQCAVAQATNKSECDLKAIFVDTEVDPAFLEGKLVFDAGTKALGTEGGIQVSSGGNISINSQNPYSSSCPADMPLFEYKGSSYSIPLSKYCNIFSIMGNIMLLIASLISMKIIMKKED